jgi:mRNA interferase MazF
VVRRGQLYWFDFGSPHGSEPGHQRPVIVIQNDLFKKSELPTSLVAAVTTNPRLAYMNGNVLLRPRRRGLREASVVNVTQLYTVNKADLGELIGTVTPTELRRIDQGLRLVLSLTNS